MNKNTSQTHSPRATVLLAVTIAVVVGVTTGCTITPEALKRQAVVSGAATDLGVLASVQEPVGEEVSLAEAVARAILHNRSRRVETMRAVLAEGQVDLAHFDMLPRLTARAGYEGRDSELASSSTSVITRQQSLEPSTSQDRDRGTWDATLSWNILDFGLSYVRAEQQADRYLVAEEQKRKVVHNIIQEVQRAWWRALSAQRLLGRVGPLMLDVDGALERSRSIEAQRLSAPMDALAYQRELLDMLRSLREVRRELSGAKAELASLMGLPPGTTFRLAEQPAGGISTSLDLPVEAMERTALVRRPELMQARYQGRISQNEVRASLVSLLPGIDLSFGASRDTNSFLVDNSWLHYGSSVSWNLLDVFRYPAVSRVNEARAQLVDEQRLALSMAVLTQLHLARLAHAQASGDLELAEEYAAVAERITEQAEAAVRTRRGGQLPLIREQLNLLLAQLRRDVAQAEVQASFLRVFVSMGLDPLPADATPRSVGELAAGIDQALARWRRGEVDLVSPEPATAPVGGAVAAPRLHPGEEAEGSQEAAQAAGTGTRAAVAEAAARVPPGVARPIAQMPVPAPAGGGVQPDVTRDRVIAPRASA